MRVGNGSKIKLPGWEFGAAGGGMRAGNRRFCQSPVVKIRCGRWHLYRQRRYDRAMITDLDIYRFAKIQIEKHGEDAPLWAARQADDMHEHGNLGGERVWFRILEAIEDLLAIEDLQSRKRPPGATAQ